MLPCHIHHCLTRCSGMHARMLALPLTRAPGIGSLTAIRLAPAQPFDRLPPSSASATVTAPSKGGPVAGEAGTIPPTRSPHEDLFAVNSARQALENLLGTTGRATASASGSAVTSSPSLSLPNRRTRRSGSKTRPEKTTDVPDAASTEIDPIAAADLEDAREEEELASDTADADEVSAHHAPPHHTDAADLDGSGPSACSLGGVPFPATIAATLSAAAASHGFTSPVWATPTQYARIGLTVDADAPAWAEIETASGPTRLFNLAQTSGKDVSDAQLARMCTAQGIYVPRRSRDASAREGGARARASHDEWLSLLPRDIRGLRLHGSWLHSVQQSPRFDELQRRSPLWISLTQTLAINAEVREDERAHAVVLPPPLTAQGSPLTAVSPHADVIRAHCDAAHAAPDAALVYNCSQLTDPARFSAAAGRGVPGCYNRSGRRYGAAMSFLLWEYSRTHGFTLSDPHDDAHQTEWRLCFCTESHVLHHNGVILPWPRGASENETPPFTLMAASGDLIVLYNAEQTSAYSAIKAECEAKIRERRDLLRQSHAPA